VDQFEQSNQEGSSSSKSSPSDLELASLSIQYPPARSGSCSQTQTEDQAAKDCISILHPSLDSNVPPFNSQLLPKTNDEHIEAWGAPCPLSSSSDSPNFKSRLFSEEEHGHEVKDDYIACLRRLSSDNSSVVILVSGYSDQDSDGHISSGSGVFFSSTSRLNVAERVPEINPLTLMNAELFAVLLALAQVENNCVKSEQVEQIVGTTVDG
jgi:hypothetical protein